MDYETLRKYQRMERNSPNLTEINPSFYTELSELIKEQTAIFKNTDSDEARKMLENIKKVSLDVFERREQKIIMKALLCSRNRDMKEQNAVEHEKTLLENLKKQIGENREFFEKVLVNDKCFNNNSAKIIEEKIEKISDENIVKQEAEPLNMVVVRILKNIPKFVSSDMKELGPFEANSTCSLPEKEAALLSEKKFAEIVM